MVKKIGNIIVFLSSIGFAVAWAHSCEVTLAATDRNGQNVTEVQVGIPFYLTATVTGNTKQLPTPALTGVDHSSIKQQSISQDISMVNGHLTASIHHIYTMVFDTEGTYTCGPAVCQKDGKEILSNTITLKAGHKTQVEVSRSQTAFASIFFDKKEALYQEPVECFIRFYYSVDGIRLQEMSQPQFKDCIAESISQPRSGVENIDGVNYRYLEWKTTIYPTATGEMTFAPIIMRYVEPHKRHSMMSGSMFGDLFGMLSGFEEQKEIYTNSAQLLVHPLPVHDPEVQAVGNFKEVYARVNNTTVSVGEGIILSLEIVGEGNLFALSHPPLKIGHQGTFYEGNATYQSDSKPPRKVFEYVLQINSPGTYELPPQELTYFDVITKSYKSITSESITLTVTGSLNTKVLDTSLPDITLEESVEVVWEPTILGEGSLRAHKAFMIPWFTLFLILCSSLAVFVGVVGFRIISAIHARGAAARAYARAFKTARENLEMSRRKKYYSHVYSVFMHMFAQRFQVDVQTLTENVLEDRLSPHLSATQLCQWRLFYVTVSEAAFGYSKDHSDIIFTQAFAWLSTFERVL